MKGTRRQVRACGAATLDPDLGTIEDVVLTVGGDPSRVLSIGSGRSARKGESGPVADLGEVLIAPALVNGHTHVANAHLKGRLHGGDGFAAWCRSMLPFFGIEPDRAALAAALEEMRRGGTCLAADMSDTHCPALAACAEEAGPELLYAVQHFGFEDPRGKMVEPPHLRALRGSVPERRVARRACLVFDTSRDPTAGEQVVH